MTQQGYYEARIKELEEREQELMSDYNQAVMSLKAVRKEKKKAFEYMNSAHYESNKDMTQIEHEVMALRQSIKRQKNKINKLSKELSQKDEKISYLNETVQDKDYLIESLKMEHDAEIAKLQGKIAELNIKNTENSEMDSEVKHNLRKENRQFKADIKALTERIDMMDKVIQKKVEVIKTKDKEIQLLHERLNWQPKKTNIFEELLEAK